MYEQDSGCPTKSVCFIRLIERLFREEESNKA